MQIYMFLAFLEHFVFFVAGLFYSNVIKSILNVISIDFKFNYIILTNNIIFSRADFIIDDVNTVK